MENFSILNFISYFILTIFFIYQLRHFERFMGASKTFHWLLFCYNTSFPIITIIYLIYYGINTTWWAPIIIFILNMILTNLFSTLINLNLLMLNTKFLPKITTISVLGIIIYPLAAIIMFLTVPQ